MRGVAIDPVKAVTAMTLAEAGYNAPAIAKSIGLAERTVYDVLNRHDKWGEIAERPVFAELRKQQNLALEAAARQFAAQSWAKAAEKMDQASYYQLVTGGAILIDKARLLGGESTQNIELHAKHEISGIDQLCSALSQVLIERQQSTSISSNQTTNNIDNPTT